MSPAHSHIIASLRRQIDAPPPGTSAVLPFADTRIDSHLASGGLPIGQLHEIAGEGIEQEIAAASGGFAACLAGALARLQPGAALLWVAPRTDLYAPGLAQYGVDLGRLILAATEDDETTLAATEAALRSGAACVVLAEVGRLTRLASRRLQLACLKQASTALVIRRWPHGVKNPPVEGNAAATRWRVRPAPAEGAPRWQVELLHARGGRPGAWIMQRSTATDRPGDGEENAPHPLRVVAVLGDNAAEAHPQPRRLAAR